MKNSVRLSDLCIDEYATIIKIDLEGQILKRVYDLGFLPEVKIKCVQKAPAGSPIAFELKGVIVALRRNDAERIYVCKQAEAQV